jgi:hypothetical protein
MVSVDTTTGKIANVLPEEDEYTLGQTNIQSTPVATVVAPYDTGGPDTPTCWQSGD